MGRAKKKRTGLRLEMDCRDSTSLLKGLNAVFGIIAEGKVSFFEAGMDNKNALIRYRGEKSDNTLEFPPRLEHGT
tara:strand:- start:1623 stop:1847 length:225 start_codon:yes stop_codon:yes gene_type:complete